MKKNIKGFWQICVLGNLRYIKHRICEGHLRSRDNGILLLAAFLRSRGSRTYVGSDNRSVFWKQPSTLEEWREWVNNGIIAK